MTNIRIKIKEEVIYSEFDLFDLDKCVAVSRKNEENQTYIYGFKCGNIVREWGQEQPGGKIIIEEINPVDQSIRIIKEIELKNI